MSVIMLIALVIVFAVILAARRSRRPRVTQIDRTIRKDQSKGDER